MGDPSLVMLVAVFAAGAVVLADFLAFLSSQETPPRALPGLVELASTA